MCLNLRTRRQRWRRPFLPREPAAPSLPARTPAQPARSWEPVDDAGGRAEAQHRTSDPRSPRVRPQPLRRRGRRRPGRRRGRGRRGPGGGGGGGAHRGIRHRRGGRRETKGRGESAAGLPLTSGRRSAVAVAGPLLLPPLLLTSTSLCRKVDPEPRGTGTQCRKRCSEAWD